MTDVDWEYWMHYYWHWTTPTNLPWWYTVEAVE